MPNNTFIRVGVEPLRKVIEGSRGLFELDGAVPYQDVFRVAFGIALHLGAAKLVGAVLDKPNLIFQCLPVPFILWHVADLDPADALAGVGVSLDQLEAVRFGLAALDLAPLKYLVAPEQDARSVELAGRGPLTVDHPLAIRVDLSRYVLEVSVWIADE